MLILDQPFCGGHLSLPLVTISNDNFNEWFEFYGAFWRCIIGCPWLTFAVTISWSQTEIWSLIWIYELFYYGWMIVSEVEIASFVTWQTLFVYGAFLRCFRVRGWKVHHLLPLLTIIIFENTILGSVNRGFEVYPLFGDNSIKSLKCIIGCIWLPLTTTL